MVASPTRVQLSRETYFFPATVRTLRFWSRKTGLAAPSRVSPPILPTQADSDAYSRDSTSFQRRLPNIHSQALSSQSRVYRIAQLRADSVHCRESAGTGPVALKVVRVTAAAT